MPKGVTWINILIIFAWASGNIKQMSIYSLYFAVQSDVNLPQVAAIFETCRWGIQKEKKETNTAALWWTESLQVTVYSVIVATGWFVISHQYMSINKLYVICLKRLKPWVIFCIITTIQETHYDSIINISGLQGDLLKIEVYIF